VHLGSNEKSLEPLQWFEASLPGTGDVAGVILLFYDQARAMPVLRILLEL
jgi:hypothetical protein